MRKLSGLERLRMAQEERERGAIEPLRNRLSAMRSTIATLDDENRELRSGRDALAAVVNSEIAPPLMDEMRRLVAERMWPEIQRVMIAAGRAPIEGVITATLPAYAVRFLDPDGVTREILNRIAHQISGRIGTRGIRRMTDRATLLRVTIPEITVEVPIDDAALRRRAS